MFARNKALMLTPLIWASDFEFVKGSLESSREVSQFHFLSRTFAQARTSEVSLALKFLNSSPTKWIRTIVTFDGILKNVITERTFELIYHVHVP